MTAQEDLDCYIEELIGSGKYDALMEQALVYTIPVNEFGKKSRVKYAIEGVYVLQCHEYYKIGHSNDVQRRCKNLNSATPYQLSIAAIIRADGWEDREILEKELHETYARYRVEGKAEWFQLPRDAIAELIALSVKQHGITI